MTYNIVEIFDSIEGEGKRAGKPATFIRLAGCNLRCTYCDTAYAFDGEFSKLNLDNIIKHISERPYPYVTLTGGEPLCADNIDSLISALLAAGHKVNIETNGSIDISPLLHAFGSSEDLFFTMDYKLPTSGVTSQMHLPNYAKLRPQDVLKFVVGNNEDAAHMINFVKTLDIQKAQIYIGVVYKSYSLKDLVQLIIKTPELAKATLQLQLHKIIWDPNERGV